LAEVGEVVDAYLESYLGDAVFAFQQKPFGMF
jgi:hypothetical protein